MNSICNLLGEELKIGAVDFFNLGAVFRVLWCELEKFFPVGDHFLKRGFAFVAGPIMGGTKKFVDFIRDVRMSGRHRFQHGNSIA